MFLNRLLSRNLMRRPSGAYKRAQLPPPVEIDSMSAVEAIASMRANPGDAAVQKKGLCQLATAARGSPGVGSRSIVAAGGIEAVVAAMNAHMGVADVQEYGCGALGVIAAMADENQVKVAAAGGIEAVVAAMKAHRGVADVQKEGCLALTFIADAAENQAKVVAAAGGIEVVVAAMNAHRAVANVQESGCSALYVIAPDAAAAWNWTKVAAMSGIEAVVVAMNAHRGVADVQGLGCKALFAIACASSENRNQVTTAGGIEAVVAAM